MSWDQHIQNIQAMSGVEEAAIYGINPVGVWAKSPKFSIEDDDVKCLCKSENEMRSMGVKLGEQKFMLLCVQDDSKIITIQLKSKKKEESDRTFNVTVCKTNKALVIVQGTPSATGGQVSKAATHYGLYLSDEGY